MYARALLISLVVVATGGATGAQQGNAAIEAETIQHFQALLKLDTSSPPGNETRAVEYLKQVFDKEGIPYQVFAGVGVWRSASGRGVLGMLARLIVVAQLIAMLFVFGGLSKLAIQGQLFAG